MNRPNLLAAAMYFANLGFSFYPTRPRSKEPFNELLPMGMMKSGKIGPVWSPFQKAQPDRTQIRTWFQIAPDANLALITGAVSNLVIIEFDEETAVSDFCDLCETQTLRDFQTPLVQSRRGYHLYFAHPGFEVRGQIGLGENCEIKGDGLSCTAPPSIHATGHLYRFLITPHDAALQPLPDIVALRLRANLVSALPVPIPPRPFSTDHGSAYGRKALQNATATLASTSAGRHKAINATAYAMGRVVGAGAMDLATAQSALENAAQSTGYSQSECARLVRDGLLAGMKSPRHIESRKIENRTQSAPVRAHKARPTLADLRGKGAFA